MRVQFNDAAEFRKELRQAPPPDRILRISELWKCSDFSPSVDYLSLVAGYLNSGGQVVELRAFCGEDWGEGFESTKSTKALCQARRQELLAVAEELGLVVCGGYFEDVSPSGH